METARQLINVVLPTEFKKLMADNRTIYEDLQSRPALPAAQHGACAPGDGGSCPHNASKIWTRSDAKAISFRTSKKGGPLWEDVYRRVTIDSDSGKVIADEYNIKELNNKQL